MAKTDMDKLGVFSQPGYVSIGDKYRSTYMRPFNEKAGKGKQLTVSSTKPRTAFQDGYFSGKFQRVMEGEAYSDPVKRRREQRIKESKRNLAGVFSPSSVPKKPSGVGSYYGTLGGKVEAFSAANKPRPKYIPPKKNFLVNPPKQGTGYGYLKVTIGERPKYDSDPYDRALIQHRKEMATSKKLIKGAPFKLNSHPLDHFQENPYRTDKKFPSSPEAKPKKDSLKPFKPSQPAKLMGGSKAGTFDPYPKHSDEPYPTVVQKPKKKFLAGVFRPSPFPKSRPVNSVVQQHVERTMNATNYLTTSASTF